MHAPNPVADPTTDSKVVWAEIFQDRRRTLAFRVILIFAITFGFGPFADARLLYPWVASYIALQLLDDDILLVGFDAQGSVVLR